ncbi:head maturation protease, ClpP-related [Desulfosporosinus sp. SYSU MS00001]|uniref:head maturation protease, ClpP-related n=1 Tax=Desulfosporosinus sp. SYSU MS00001 TaxID=3416284 RepID=UPI003CF3DCC0
MRIEIKGPRISDSQQWIYDWLEMPATSPKKVNDLINQALPGEELEVIINSGGGSVFAGSEIFTTLRSHNGNTKGKIVGLAASAASMIAMGVKDLSIAPTGQIMIHRASTYGEGNAEDMQKTVDMLKGVDKSIANAYILKTGISQSKLLDMMSKETWLDADTAKEMGFVNSIMFEDEFQAVATIDNSAMIPEKLINKIMDKVKNEIELKNKSNQNNNDLELAKAMLKIKLL